MVGKMLQRRQPHIVVQHKANSPTSFMIQTIVKSHRSSTCFVSLVVFPNISSFFLLFFLSLFVGCCVSLSMAAASAAIMCAMASFLSTQFSVFLFFYCLCFCILRTMPFFIFVAGLAECCSRFSRV